NGFDAPMASAVMALYAHRLGWKIENRYEMLNDAVAHAWDWGHDGCAPSAIPALKRMLALDPNFRVLVAQGLTDVQVPYFGPPGRLAFKAYAGGHMPYLRDASRTALREAASKIIEAK